MSRPQLCLHHELALLILDDSKGTFEGSMYHYGLAGAILSELLLQGIIKVSPDDQQMVSLALSKPTGDPILDEVIEMIGDAKKPWALKHWVPDVARIKDLHHRVASQLTDLGIVSFNESKVLWLFARKVYPEIDGSYEEAIRQRLAEIMFKPGTKPDERTAVLIAFAKTSGVLDANFAKVELRQHDKRITDICEGKLLAAGATQAAIDSVQTAIMAATIAASVAATTAATVN